MILRKIAKCKLAKIHMLGLKPKGTITSCILTFCLTQAHYISHSYSVLRLISNAWLNYIKDNTGKGTINNSCIDIFSTTKTAMLLHENSACVKSRRYSAFLPELVSPGTTCNCIWLPRSPRKHLKQFRIASSNEVNRT